jgi:hypothetical protein
LNGENPDGEARRAASAAWFHAFAELGRDEIARRWAPETERRLADHLAWCLTGVEMPAVRTAEQFAEVVLDLRANERDWERAWMAAVVEADDLVLAGQEEEAAHTLNEFARACPWTVFGGGRRS